MSPTDEIILRALSQAAEAGVRCPTNIELSVAAGLETERHVSATFQRLTLEGAILVERRSNARCITIVATGKSTASVGHRTIRTTEHRPLPDALLPPRVFRDPCPRCAVRADIGCRHGWTGEFFEVAA